MIYSLHKIGKSIPDNRDWATVEMFEDLLKKSKQIMYLADYLANDREGDVITFDDIHSSVFYELYPVLKYWNIPFELFVVFGLIGHSSITFDRSQDGSVLCNYKQLNELRAIGGRIQHHTQTHKNLTGLSKETIEMELMLPENIELGADECQYFSYPYGHLDDKVVDIVRGYFKGAVSMTWGDDKDPYTLHRRYGLI